MLFSIALHFDLWRWASESTLKPAQSLTMKQAAHSQEAVSNSEVFHTWCTSVRELGLDLAPLGASPVRQHILKGSRARLHGWKL